MNPTAGDVHVDAALSAVSVSYRNPNFIWETIFPVIPSDKQSDKYFTYDKADLMRNEAAVRAPGTLAQRGGYRVSNTAYFCDNYAFGKATPDEAAQNSDEALDQQNADTEYVSDMVQRKAEITLAAAIFATSVWGTDKSVSVQWDTYATSNPIDDVQAGIDIVLQNTGMEPNTLVLGQQTWTEGIKNHPDFVDRLSNQATMVLQLETAAAILGVPKIIVGKGSYNTAGEGETFSGSYIWGKNALLCYVPGAPGKRTPASGYTMRWGPQTVLRYRDTPPGLKQDVIEAHDYLDFVVTGSDLGYYFDAVVA